MRCFWDSRSSVLVEPGVVAVPGPVVQLLAVDVVLSAPVALDDAHEDEQQDEEGHNEHHSHEPAGRCHIVRAHQKATFRRFKTKN